MRMYGVLFAAACAVAASGVVCAQTASTRVSHSVNGLGAISFNYDAQHDRVTADGLRMMAFTGNTNPVPFTGTIKVQINVTAHTQFPKNTEIHCTALAVGGILDPINEIVAGGLETANVVATAVKGVNGGYDCFLTIPFRWPITPDPAAASGLIVAIGVSAIGPMDPEGGKGDDNGKGDDKGRDHDTGVIRSTLQVDGVESLPASGAITRFAFEVYL